MTRIKICGITRLDDAWAAVDAGADAIGFIFADSPRQITPDAARTIAKSLPPFICRVGVFRNASENTVRDIVARIGLNACQFHGDESPGYCDLCPARPIKRVDPSRIDSAKSLQAVAAAYRVAVILLDPGGGSGQSFDWSLARDFPGPLILAGGLTPENVGDAIRIARPYAVDVSSGVESSPGRKDPLKLHRFIQAVRSADDRCATR